MGEKLVGMLRTNDYVGVDRLGKLVILLSNTREDEKQFVTDRLNKAGIDGVYPLERQAGVDIVKIRQEYPEFIMLGGYDKMVMNKGEEAIRTEFERILPVMRSEYYIPSVDHQTPPGVSFEDYKIYVKLFKEYCEKAVK